MGVPRDFETIYRSFLRLTEIKRKKNLQLLSGDSFRLLCSREFSVAGSGLKLVGIHQDNPTIFYENIFIFCPIGLTAELVHSFRDGLLCDSFIESNLILHNGDHSPTQEQINFLTLFFRKIFTINFRGSHPNVCPVPIGLENESKLRNGVENDYLKLMNKLQTTEVDRDIFLLVCFNVFTNPIERMQAFEYGKKVPGSMVIDSPVTPRKYRELLMRSRYVLSPPGNGMDCHRTWEALYLGATPVVKSKYWPFSNFQLPVVKVEDWVDLLDMGNFTNVQKYESFPKYPKDWLT